MIALPSALNMKFEEIYKDLSSPICLSRMDENENIAMVAGEKMNYSLQFLEIKLLALEAI